MGGDGALIRLREGPGMGMGTAGEGDLDLVRFFFTGKGRREGPATGGLEGRLLELDEGGDRDRDRDRDLYLRAKVYDVFVTVFFY